MSFFFLTYRENNRAFTPGDIPQTQCFPFWAICGLHFMYPNPQIIVSPTANWFTPSEAQAEHP
jgi:hypothetical protein